MYPAFKITLELNESVPVCIKLRRTELLQDKARRVCDKTLEIDKVNVRPDQDTHMSQASDHAIDELGFRCVL